MAPYIFMQRNNVHILDLKQSQTLLDEAADAAGRFAQRGKKILFVGTKKQAQSVVRDQAERAGMPYVAERWLGGMLTNFQTIRQSIRRMEQLQKMETDGTLGQLKKKERLMRRREREKLEKTLGGIADLGRLPGALLVVDLNREHIAVKEARRLGIPIIAMLDTNCDPDLVDFPIPANDDAMRSIEVVIGAIVDAIREGSQSGDLQREAAQAEQDSMKAEREQVIADAEKADARRSPPWPTPVTTEEAASAVVADTLERRTPRAR